MPTRDPNDWKHLAELLRQLPDLFPNIAAALLTFALAFTRGLRDGGPMKQSALHALTITLLVCGLFPLFVDLAARYELGIYAALAPCVFLAVMGVDWLRAKADDIYELVIGRWRK